MSVLSEEEEIVFCSDDSDEEHIGEKCIALFSSLLNDVHQETQQASNPVEVSKSTPLSIISAPADIFLAATTDPYEEVVLEEQLLDEMASSSHSAAPVLRQRPQVPPKPPIDTVRYSMNNLQESSDWQLDALLEELSALETQLNSSSGGDEMLLGIPTIRPQQKPPEPSSIVVAPTPTPSAVLPPPAPPVRSAASAASSCSSPDGDSAFCDGSSTESRNRNSAFSSSDSCRDSLHTPSPTQISPRATEQTAEDRKAQKIKEALEKMKEAKVTRIFVKFFVEDGDPLQMLVDERWTVAETMRQLADKNHITLSEDHCIVEEFPELYIKRIYEDHEMLVENIQMWLQDSQNKLHFTRRPDKYPFIDRPELYLVTERTTDLEVPQGDQWTRETKQRFVEDFFSRETVAPPELEGFLYLKSDGRKSWKKHYFVLRASGLYYNPKGKKVTTTKDLQCLMNLHSNQVYAGVNWAKKYKAPSDYCISIKLTQLQIKNSQYIKYICAEDEPTFRRWIVALRIAKNGSEIYQNYLKACDARRVAMGHGLSRATSSTASSILLQEPHCSQASSCSSSQQDLRSKPSCTSPSQLSRVSQLTAVSAAQSTTLEFEEMPTGTIKRAPMDVVRRISQSGSSRSPSLGGDHEDEDSDEDFPAPPPVFASRTTTPSIKAEPRPLPAVPPPKPAYHPPPPQSQQHHLPPTPSPAPSFTHPISPSPSLQSTPRKMPPPPPPKRSDETRVQSTASTPSHMGDLEAALARRREKMAQHV